MHTSRVSPAQPTILLMNMSSPNIHDLFLYPSMAGGLKMIISPTAGSRLRYDIFSATNRSPTSYVGYIDNEGMYLASAT